MKAIVKVLFLNKKTKKQKTPSHFVAEGTIYIPFFIGILDGLMVSE